MEVVAAQNAWLTQIELERQTKIEVMYPPSHSEDEGEEEEEEEQEEEQPTAAKSAAPAAAVEQVAAKLADVAVWANAQDFTAAAVSEFLGVADYQLIAHAAAHGHTIVTHEQPQAGAKRRVLIPNVCLALGVDFCNTFTMLRSHSVQLDLRLTSAS